MLKKISIQNFALIKSIEIDFDAGLNIITGETGAGKSILVGALGSLLGAKVSKESIRRDCDKAIIEGEFDIQNNVVLNTLLKELELESDDNILLLRREVNVSGRSRCFVNDSPVNINQLEEIGNLLVDLHGQHDHQQLLNSSKHIFYIDDYANLGELVSQVEEAFTSFQASKKHLSNLLSQKKTLDESQQLFEFQLKELKAASPKENEDTELEQEEKILKNSELLFNKSQQLLQLLYEDEQSVFNSLHVAQKTIGDLVAIDENVLVQQQECESAKVIVQELGAFFQNYSDKIIFDPERLEEIRQRISLLNSLKKKYGGTIAAVVERIGQLEEQLGQINNIDHLISTAEQHLKATLNVLKEKSLTLSKNRLKASKNLGENVGIILKDLGMPNAQFSVSQTYKLNTSNETYFDIDNQPVLCTPNGIDDSEFMFSANIGEDLKPLSKVASGGEISRVMLALKTVLAESDKVPVLIFDEIDSGISGRIARIVGKALVTLSKSHQILCITHLPQIASLAKHHYIVDKVVYGESTETIVNKLDKQDKITHIAKMIGGEQLTEAHLKSAESLLNES